MFDACAVQWITTYGILKNRFCTVPAKSGLWKLGGLKKRGIYFPDYDDSKTCWHGQYYKDCNRDIQIVAYGCKWWHFYPSETFEDHAKKFNELTDDAYELKITNGRGGKSRDTVKM